MATFSVNQARQLYVATSVKSPHVLPADAAGSIALKNDTAKTHLYFEYKGADNLMRSDLIDIKNILHAKATDAKKMAYELKSVTVTLDNTVNGGAPVAGQDYILRIAFRQYVGMSDADQYFKYGMVHAYTGMSASDFYKKLALSLVKNFSRETTQLLSFTLEDGEGEGTVVDASTKESALTGTYTALVIDEVAQEWVLGKIEQAPVYFEVQPTTITVEGDELVWGKVEDTDPAGTIGNGQKIADLEYFCMGERGDIYRGVGYPNNIKTEYMVNPESAYAVLYIHYAYVGANEGVQKSEKILTIVSTTESILNEIKAAIA